MAKPEIYVSVDIEADGPIPGINSMLNVGMAAFRLDQGDPLVPIDTFEVNLKPLPEAEQDPDTMDFWAKNPEAWNYVTSNTVSAEEGMRKAGGWAANLPGKPVMVVYPTYDFMWMRWYLVRFCPDQARVFGFQALDIKTLAMAAMNHPTFKGISKRSMSKFNPDWFKDQPEHDHTGLADAIGQGMLFVRILQALRGSAADVAALEAWVEGKAYRQPMNFNISLTGRVQERLRRTLG